MSVAPLPPALLEQATLASQPLGNFAWRFARGHRLSRLYCRTVSEWQKTLRDLGFAVEAIPMHRGIPCANILLVARLPGRAATSTTS
jgi:hypothetical protein